ncbi:hypothetical protein HHI36_021050 [Cryptolaemus montrouzieri]|uniref:Axonemal 84 kDa protein n=1 Tax=Cryptolaemus montrouzieri TaxID=559131 RepID=A0ABD2MVJ4_9CUCU
MVEKKLEKSTTKAKGNRNVKKNKSPQELKRENTGKSNVSSFLSLGSTESLKDNSMIRIFEYDSSEPINNRNAAIPTSGAALLQWTKDNMSFESVTSGEEESLSEEEQVQISFIETKKSDKKRKTVVALRQKVKRTDSRKSKIAQFIEKRSDDKIEDMHVQGPFEDDVMFQWRMKKEEEKRFTKRKAKSEVTFVEPSDPDLLKQESSQIITKKFKLGEKRSRKSTMAMKKEAERKAEEERAAQKRRDDIFQKALMKQQQEKEEEVLRKERNAITLAKIRSIEKERLDKVVEEQKKREWNHYLACQRVPWVTRCDQIFGYTEKSKAALEKTTLEEVTEICGVIMELLKQLDELLFYTSPNETEKIDKFKWSKELLRKTQQEILNETIYKILSDYRKNLEIDNLEFGEFFFKSDYFTIFNWLKLDWPISMPNPRNPPPPNVEINFSKFDLNIIFPLSLTGQRKIVQCVHYQYDHISDSCSSFKAPPVPDYRKRDLIESYEYDSLVKRKYLYESSLRAEHLKNVELHKNKHGDTKYQKQFELPVVPLDENIPDVPLQDLEPTPSEYLDLADDLKYERSLKDMQLHINDDHINLREYYVIGGIYQIYLVYHPPQPQPLIKFNMTVNTVKPPRKFEHVPFYAKFVPPTAPWQSLEPQKSTSSTTRSFKSIRSRRLTAKYASKSDAKKGNIFDPNEIQKYKDAQERWAREVEREKEKMVFIGFQLPQDVIFLERPNVCLWNEKDKCWTSSDIYDTDYEIQSRKITFRTSRFGIFGLVVRKHLNFPYKSWDIRPNRDDSISVTLNGPKVTIILRISENKIQIENFEYRLSNYLVGKGLQKLVSKEFNLARLIETLRLSGLDIFPEHDVNCYYFATVEKHWSMSYITYYSMARMAIRYNFCSSKWNMETGRRSIVVQMREYNPKETTSILNPFSLIHVTPLKCEPLLCSDEDAFFSDAAPAATKFQPNLYYLLKSTSTVTNRAKINMFSNTTVHTLAQFLVHTRVFSFS